MGNSDSGLSRKTSEYFAKKMPTISGNKVNGLGESEVRKPSPFFWHKPELHPFGALQKEVTDYHQTCQQMRTVFTPTADRGPKPVKKNETTDSRTEQQWTQVIKAFARANESDLVGITTMNPLWVYDGFEIREPWLIVIGVAMDYEKLAQVPPSFENPTSAVEVGDKYNKAARACRELTNHILAQGFEAKAFQGPYATALNMVPAALEAGFGELGKHGSIINREFGSNFRLSAVTTDMPLVADKPDIFGADDFCTGCQVCVKACPPNAISNEKQLVRGIEKWYVDFDKCIPYFGEALGCAACIATCPWSSPGRAPKLAKKWAVRSAKTKSS